MEWVYGKRSIVLSILLCLIFLSMSLQLWVGWKSSSQLSNQMMEFLESYQYTSIGPKIRHNVTSLGRNTPKSLEMLQKAGLNLTNLGEETIASIPDWTTIENTLGSSTPHILGLDTCQAFQSMVKNR